MKSFATLSALALVAAATAVQTSRLFGRQSGTCLLNSVENGATDEQIAASVNQWSSDVQNVNSFLNSAAGLPVPALVGAANAAFLSAQDEPCQLDTLSNFDADTPATDCATKDLKAIFGVHVLTNLKNIIANPHDAQAVSAAVADINLFRCCSVLPDADILWTGASNKVTSVAILTTLAARPLACASITCTSAQTNCKAAT
ncbi:hypothetical protein LTR42_002264 [Elasticomyces elasticus]|nr:hypothetical protein LTR42_002264 [Elasticomyces elasticus]